MRSSTYYTISMVRRDLTSASSCLPLAITHRAILDQFPNLSMYKDVLQVATMPNTGFTSDARGYLLSSLPPVKEKGISWGHKYK